MRYTLLFIFSLGVLHLLTGQTVTKESAETKKGYSYDLLYKKIKEHRDDSIKKKGYLHAFLSKAKTEGNWKEVVNGYKYYLHFSEPSLRLQYADSMVVSAIASKDTTLVASAYVTKGMVYLNQRHYKDALNQLLTADKLANSVNISSYLHHKINYNLAQVYYQLEQYPKAINLFNAGLAYFKEKQPKAYLVSLHALTRCHTQMKNFGLSSELNFLGIREGERLGDSFMVSYFVHSEGVNSYAKEDYKLAIAQLDSALPGIVEKKDLANIAITHFYLGKSCMALDSVEAGITHFSVVDSIFNVKGYITPELKESYRILKDYYQAKGDMDTYLYYIDQLLEVKKAIHERYKDLSTTIYDEYSTAKLVKEKQYVKSLQAKKARNETLFIGGLSLLSVVVLFGGYRFYVIRQGYKKRFEAIKLDYITPSLAETKVVAAGELNIPEEKVAEILEKLKKFEKCLKFKDEDWTLGTLAASFNINTRYLSKVILHYKGQHFNDYLNAIRVQYVVGLLETDPKTRRYTISALAREAGYSNTGRFTRAFKNIYGIPPSYYLKRLDG